ncbi:MAG: hypothetical protein LAQ30_21590, partial [Acidobacteriia bacterium]|nr:hypothetical protein [Terriglobia bacterium]
MASNNENTSTTVGTVPPQQKSEKPTENQAGAPAPPSREHARDSAGNSSADVVAEKTERPERPERAERPERQRPERGDRTPLRPPAAVVAPPPPPPAPPAAPPPAAPP